MVFAHILNINTCMKGVMNIFNNLLSISRGQNPSPSPTVVLTCKLKSSHYVIFGKSPRITRAFTDQILPHQPRGRLTALCSLKWAELILLSGFAGGLFGLCSCRPCLAEDASSSFSPLQCWSPKRLGIFFNEFLLKILSAS